MARCVILCVIAGLLSCAEQPPPAGEPSPAAPSAPIPGLNRYELETGALADWAARGEGGLRLGYFHGGRNMLLYRAMDDGAYDRAGIQVSFWARRDNDSPDFHRVPERIDHLEYIRDVLGDANNFGRTTGPEIMAEIAAGQLHCGMIGESSFLLAVDEQRSWTAVAKLGQDTAESPGKVVLVRSALDISGPRDLRGLRVGSRASGPYDMVMVREWLEHQGVPLDDVVLEDMIVQEELKRKLREEELDVAFLHLHIASAFAATDGWEAYPGFTFDFADPELSQSLLVCRDDAIVEYRETLVRFLAAYKRRIDYEYGLSEHERLAFEGDKAMGMELTFFDGLNLPQYRAEPTITLPTLLEMQRLLVKHGIVSAARPVERMVDNSLIDEALARVAALGEQPYPGAPEQGSSGVMRGNDPVVIPGSAAERLLAVLDRDGDGLLDMAEFESAAVPGMRFAAWDMDWSHTIDAEELRQGLLRVSPLTPYYRHNPNVKERPVPRPPAED